MDAKYELLQALKELHAVVPYLKGRRAPLDGWRQLFTYRHGICGNVYGYLKYTGRVTKHVELIRLLEDLFAHWPGAHFGVRAYPVGGTKEYQEAENAHTLWCNPKRVELLEWLITTLTEELSHEPVQSWSPTP